MVEGAGEVPIGGVVDRVYSMAAGDGQVVPVELVGVRMVQGVEESRGYKDRGEAVLEAEEWAQDPGEELSGEKQTGSKFDEESAPVVETSSAEVVADHEIQEVGRTVRDQVQVARDVASGFVAEGGES